MKKILSKLGLVAVMASALFVSCIKGNEPTIIPAFPSEMSATYSQNATTQKYAWSFSSDYKWTDAHQWVGFEIDPVNSALLNYYIEPNAKWSVKIVSGTEYLALRVAKNGGDGFADDLFNDRTSTSGNRGKVKLTLKVLKTPAYGDEPVECKMEMTMAGDTMPLATITLEPAVVPTPEVEESENNENGGEGTGENTEENSGDVE